MKRGHSSFSLLELVVALAITVVLVGVMLTVSVKALGVWHRAQDASTLSTNAKLALDTLEQDLQAVILRRQADAWLAVDLFDTFAAVESHGWVKRSGERIKPEHAISRVVSDGNGAPLAFKDSRNGFSGAWLRFITTKLDSNLGSDNASSPVAVGYQLVRRGFGADARVDARYALYRSVVAQKSTFLEGYAIASGGYAVPSGVDGLPGSILSPSGTRLLAVNVVDFGVRLYARSGSGVALTRVSPTSGNSYRLDAAIIPEAADVLLRILTEEGAVLLSAMESGRVAMPANHESADAWWWSVVEAHSRVFVRRIRFRSAAP